MKKIIALLLAVMICLLMMACSNNEKYTKYDTLIQMIEADDYQNALSELDKFFGEKINNSSSVGNNEDSTPIDSVGNNEDSTPIESPLTELKDIIIGTWVREYTYNGKYYVTTIEIFPGGTGTFQTKETDDDWVNPYGTELPDKTTWEIKDDIINITIKGYLMFPDSVKGYVYSNDEKESLQTVDGKMAYYRKAE